MMFQNNFNQSSPQQRFTSSNVNPSSSSPIQCRHFMILLSPIESTGLAGEPQENSQKLSKQDSQTRLGAIIMGGQPGKLQSPSAFPASTNVGRNDHMMFQSMDNQRSPPNAL